MKNISNILRALFGPRFVFANVATGTHEGGITKNLEQAVSTRHLLGTPGSTSSDIDLCGESDFPLGVITDQGDVGDAVNVALLGARASTVLMVANKAIGIGEPLYTAANGQVQNQPTTPGDYYHVGYALTTATANGDTLEAIPVPPRKVKALTPFTGAATSDIATLAAALSEAPDKIIILN